MGILSSAGSKPFLLYLKFVLLGEGGGLLTLTLSAMENNLLLVAQCYENQSIIDTDCWDSLFHEYVVLHVCCNFWLSN